MLPAAILESITAALQRLVDRLSAAAVLRIAVVSFAPLRVTVAALLFADLIPSVEAGLLSPRHLSSYFQDLGRISLFDLRF